MRKIEYTKLRSRALTTSRSRVEVTLTFTCRHVAAPKTARFAHSTLRSNQHVSIRANVVYRRAYRSLGSYNYRILRFLRTAAGRWLYERMNKHILVLWDIIAFFSLFLLFRDRKRRIFCARMVPTGFFSGPQTKFLDTYCSGRSSEGNRGCSRRHSRASRDLRRARRSFARHCNCLADPCPRMASARCRL